MAKKDKDIKRDYRYYFNKIFTGSYLDHNLGHEIINFMKMDGEHKRYVYINPWGDIGEIGRKKCEYVFHVMETSSESLELIAVSKIVDKDKAPDYKSNKEEKEDIKLYFNKNDLDKIFEDKTGVEDLAHKYSLRASDLLRPKDGVRIFFKRNSDESKVDEEDKKNIKVYIQANPQRNKAFSSESDAKELPKIFKYLVSYDKYPKEELNEIIDTYPLEPCFSVISDRTKLEDSTSNQLAYFLNRDKKVMAKFIKLINSKLDNKISTKEEFGVLREINNIDLLFRSDNYLIVLENKIDSDINGVNGKRKNGKIVSQLSKYYEDVMTPSKKKDKASVKQKKKYYEGIDNKLFFLLVPDYSVINENYLNDYLDGDKYNIITYKELYNALKGDYMPFGSNTPDDSKFLYNQFIDGLRYISQSKAEQRMELAYIRLKQRLEELNIKGE